MSDENLIEKAAKAIADVHNEGHFERYQDAWRMEARAALAVFREHTAPEGHERTPIYDGNEHVCSGCVNSEGNNVAWDQVEHTSPTDDEREAMIAEARRLIAHTRTYNFGLWSADKLAHKVAGELADALESTLAELRRGNVT